MNLYWHPSFLGIYLFNFLRAQNAQFSSIIHLQCPSGSSGRSTHKAWRAELVLATKSRVKKDMLWYVLKFFEFFRNGLGMGFQESANFRCIFNQKGSWKSPKIKILSQFLTLWRDIWLFSMSVKFFFSVFISFCCFFGMV